MRMPVTMLYDFVVQKFQLGEKADDVRTYLRQNGYPENEIDTLLKKYFKELEKNNKEDVLKGSTNQEDWYGGPKLTKNSVWSRLKQSLNNKQWSNDMVESLDHASTCVVSKLANPEWIKNEENKIAKGLVLGYVQSGKTANYSAVIAKAIDAGYKFIIVLSGIHNNLRYQTEVRLKQEIIGPNETNCITLTRTDQNGDFSPRASQSANRACGQDQGFSMAVIKKNVSVLRNFNFWLNQAKKMHLENCPVLIIDDESDQASINTSKQPELNPTAINSAIRALIAHFKVVSYLGYTATPFANVLIDSNVDDDLYPKDFIISLRKPKSYTGAEELFGVIDPVSGQEKPGLPIIREIPKQEANVIYQITKPKNPNYGKFLIGPALDDAIHDFILACAVRMARKQWKQHFSMLIHCTHKIEIQKEIFKQVEQFKEDMRMCAHTNHDTLKGRLKTRWLNDFLPTTQTIDPERGAISFETIWRNCTTVLEQIQVILDNSESDQRLSYENKFWGIIIGGNTLSIGLTLEGLMISYFVRTTNYYDSLMQMGRWFGYRGGYLDLTRIYMTDDLKDRFYHLANVENEIREEIRAMADSGDKPIDVGIRVRTHSSMTVTSPMKMRTAERCKLTYSYSKLWPSFIDFSQKSLLEDRKAVDNLLFNLEKYGARLEKSHFHRFKDSLLYRKVSSELILQFLDEINIHEENIRFTRKNLSRYIRQLNEVNELTDWSVAVVSTSTSVHKVSLNNGKTIGLADRSLSEILSSHKNPDVRYLKNVSFPVDEYIDMGDLVDKCPSNVNDFQMIEGEKRGPTYLRRKYRPKDRGLLLIHPIRPTLQIRNQKTVFTAPEVIFGIGFVFPQTNSDKGQLNYVENVSINN